MAESALGSWRRSLASRLTSGPAVLIYVIAGAVLIIAAVWLVPQWIVLGDAGDGQKAAPLTSAERIEAITTTRQLMLLAAGGLLAIIGIIFTWRRDRTARALAELERDANFTTRYTEAIAQLGDQKSLAIRLGGIYALERIAGDSIRDRQTILDVLAAYLRTQSPAAGGSSDSEVPELPAADVEAAATVFGRVTRMSPPQHQANLIAADLRGANLTDTDLTDAYLTNANLAYAYLTNANLTDADLTNANLGDANLTNANLTNANLTDANLDSAILHRAKLHRAALYRANLNDIRLGGADLTYANLGDAKLTNANLVTADLTDANLTDANLTNANLGDANLTKADLTDANLTEANLTEANLTEANLTNANLVGTNLVDATLARVTFDKFTSWPEGFVRPERSPRLN